MHGGKSLVGAAVGTFKNGRHSKYMPERLAERYQEMRADPDMLALRDDIALIDVRLSEAVGALNTGESQSAWAALGGLWAEFAAGWEDFDRADMTRAIEQIGAVIVRGSNEPAVWLEIRSLVKQRADLVANERQRLVQLQQMVTSEQAMVLIANVLDTVKRHVTDRTALAAISADFMVLANRGQQAGASA